MRRSIVFALWVVASCSSESGGVKTKHAVIIGIDGVRVDVLQQASTPR